MYGESLLEYTNRRLNNSTTYGSRRYHLTPAQRSALEAALREVKSRGLPFHQIRAADFPLPALEPLVAQLRRNLSWGRGFALLSGFPIDHDEVDTERAFWLLSSHIGLCLSQDGNASLMHYVTDVLERPDNPPSRFAARPRPFTTETYAPTSGRNSDAFFHADLTDALALLCVRQNPDKPRSVVSSAGALYRRLAQSNGRCAALEELRRGCASDPHHRHKNARRAIICSPVC